jgi:hypothetical protein
MLRTISDNPELIEKYRICNRDASYYLGISDLIQRETRKRGITLVG